MEKPKFKLYLKKATQNTNSTKRREVLFTTNHISKKPKHAEP